MHASYRPPLCSKDVVMNSVVIGSDYCVNCDEGIASELSEMLQHADSLNFTVTRMCSLQAIKFKIVQSRRQSGDVLEFQVTNPFIYNHN